jgi:hypothetical protein
MVSIEGTGRGPETTNYSINPAQSGVPLLSSFYFRFVTDSLTAQVDNHLNIVRMMPPGSKQDLSPSAQLPLSVVENGKIALEFADRKLDDEKDNYFYKVAHDLYDGRRYQIRDVGCIGTCERVIPLSEKDFASSIFALVGFQVYFTGGRDHQIDEIAIFEDNSNLVVKFNDRNDDDVFGYIVDFAMVSTTGQRVQTGEFSGESRGGARIPLSGENKVIRGFHFDYKFRDHHLREMGVLSNPDNLEVYFGDQNGDDPFKYTVKWAQVTSDFIGSA